MHLETDGIKGEENREGHEAGHGDVAGLFDAGVTPDPPVQTEHSIGTQLHNQCNKEE